MTGEIPAEEINRMRWASRRGMLELDLVLEPSCRPLPLAGRARPPALSSN